MKAKDLRIGNLILFPTEANNGLLIPLVIRKVDAIEIGKVTSLNPPSSPSNFEAKIKNCGGIKLTEEWLTKFGFKITDGYFHKDDIWLTPDFGLDGIDPFKPIKYVHQLQNIFFAITGTELEMKKK